MKKIILTLSFAAFTALAAFAQIHSSGGQVYVIEGALSSYTNPDIYVEPKYHFRTNSWTVTCTIVDPSIDVQEVVEFTLPFLASEVDAFTGAGTETERIIDVCEQVVIEYLEHISSNSGITFTQ